MSDSTPGAQLDVRMRRRPLTLADILDGMFDLFVAQWRTYVLAIGFVVVPVSFVSSYLELEVFGGAGLIEQFTNPEIAGELLAGGPGTAEIIGLVGVTLFTALLITPLVSGAAHHIAAQGYEARPVTPAQALGFAFRRYGALVMVTVMVALVSAIILLLPVALLIGGGAAGNSAMLAAGGGLLVVMVLVLAGVLVLFTFAHACVIVEGAGPFTALRRSTRLVRGQVLRVLGTVVLAGLLAGLIAQILALPFQLPGDRWGPWLAVVLTTIASVLISLLTTPLTTNAVILLYFDTRIRKEGYDLDALIDDIAVGVQSGQRSG